MDPDILFLVVPMLGLGGLLIVLILMLQLAGINRKLKRTNAQLADIARALGQR